MQVIILKGNHMHKIDRSHYLYSNKDLKKLIFPLILEQTLAITVGMADAMMVSSVGEAAISGVSLVDMINNLIFGILSAIATGGAVIVGQPRCKKYRFGTQSRKTSFIFRFNFKYFYDDVLASSEKSTFELVFR